VVAVGNVAGDAPIGSADQPVAEAELCPQAAVLAVVHVTGDEDEVGVLIDGQADVLWKHGRWLSRRTAATSGATTWRPSKGLSRCKSAQWTISYDVPLVLKAIWSRSHR